MGNEGSDQLEAAPFRTLELNGAKGEMIDQSACARSKLVLDLLSGHIISHTRQYRVVHIDAIRCSAITFR